MNALQSLGVHHLWNEHDGFMNVNVWLNLSVIFHKFLKL